MSHRKAPPVENDEPNMQGQRARTQAGTLREKRGDTHVSTIEALYHVDLNARGDMHLDTLLERERADSLSELLRRKR